MRANSVAENVLGTLGAVCWTAQLLPQVWKSWREKSTKGLSPWLVLLWAISAIFLGLFGFLCLISWSQCLHYGIAGGLQAGLVFAVMPSYDKGENRPVAAFGILSSVLLSLALFPQYYEIYKHKEVVGISIPFIFIDMMGGVFSDLSLIFKERFDVIAGVAYSLVIVLDAVVLLLALILNPRARRARRRAAIVNPQMDNAAIPGVPSRRPSLLQGG
ncbi:hypothetical protein AB1N83_009500 [Pleurotus pulmonarius]